MSFKEGNVSRGLGLIILIFLLSSCASLRKSNTLFQSEYDKFADTAKSVYVANEHTERDSFYRIKPFDLVGIRNLQNPQGLVSATTTTEGTQSTTTFKVDQWGIVTLPVVGPVMITGLTQPEAAQKIKNLYAEKLLKDPIIEVSVINNKVILLGEIGKPGNYELERENYNLIELIGEAGGLLPSSDVRKIKIIRGDLKDPEIIFINLKDVNSLTSDKIYLKNSDIVYIPSRGIYSTNESVKTYLSVLQPAILVLNTIFLIYTIAR